MEEKGGVLHIIFIFAGICLICLGTFYFFTDENMNLDKNNKKEEVADDNKDIIKQINLMSNVEASFTLKNKKEVKIKYIVDSETYKKAFYYNNNLVFEMNELEQCDQFYLYNNSIISYCYHGSATSGHLYIVDSNGNNTLIDKFENNKMIPESIQLKDNKLIVNGMGVYEGAILKIDDKEIELCNEDAVLENNIDLHKPAYADYELVIKNDKPEFNYIKTTKTLEEIISESCKIVE